MMSYDGLFGMIAFFMEIDLLPEEKIALTDFLDSFGKSKTSTYVGGQLTRAIFEQLFIVDHANR